MAHYIDEHGSHTKRYVDSYSIEDAEKFITDKGYTVVHVWVVLRGD